MKENWKNIVGFEGLYQISNLGRVKSLERVIDDRHHIRCRILKQTTSKDGYVRVGMRKNKKAYTRTVHRLVAEAFIPNPNNLPEVNHLDGDKQNNSVDNLSWCTSKENQNHSLNIGLRKASKLNGGGTIRVTKTINERIDSIAKETGVEKWDVVNRLLLKALEIREGEV